MPPLLAHGALGYWDEVIFAGIIIVILSLMAVSWFRSRELNADFDEPPAVNSRPVAQDELTTSTDNKAERFSLD